MWTWDAVAVRGEDGKIKGSLALMTRKVPGIGRTLMYEICIRDSSKPTSWLFMQSHIVFHLACIGDLSCGSGLLPF